MKTATPTLLVIPLALALAACTQGDQDNATGSAMDAPPARSDTAAGNSAATARNEPAHDAMAMADPAAASASNHAGDRKALMALEEVDRHEIAASEAALSKGVKGEVRSFADSLHADHSRNLEATRKMMGGMGGMGEKGGMASGDMRPARDGTNAGAMGSDAAMHSNDPEFAAMKKKHDDERQRLARLDGDEFSKAWVAAMVKDHEEALAKLDNELIPGASNAEVTRHLQATRTAMAGHLDTARALQSQTGR